MSTPHGPPFTVERYGTFGQSVIAERDWLLEEVERLRREVAHLRKTCADFGVHPARVPDEVPPEHQGCTFECAGCYATVVLPFTDATKTHVKVGPMQGWTAGAEGGVRCPKCSTADVGDKHAAP